MGATLRTACRFVAVCACLGIFAAFIGIVSDLMLAGGLNMPTHFGFLTLRFKSDLPDTPGVAFVWQAAAVLLNDIPNFLMIAVYVFLFRLMLDYARGEVFSASALRHLNITATLFLASVLVGFIVSPLATMVQTWPLGHGHRYISVGLGTKDIIALFQAGIVFVIAQVMNRAHRLADENARFV